MRAFGDHPVFLDRLEGGFEPVSRQKLPELEHLAFKRLDLASLLQSEEQVLRVLVALNWLSREIGRAHV